MLRALALLVLALFPATAEAQGILLPTDSIERLLRDEPFEIIDRRGSRFEGDRTSRVALTFADGTLIPAKWAPAPPGGETFNNVPRYELAAYELQKLFLDEADYVVPPTVVRAFPLDWYRELDPHVRPTFARTGSVLVALQYWLFNVSPDDVWDRGRFQSDTTYARHFADFNIFTYLARHGDENEGNYLISRSADNPRVFAVDNGVAFGSDRSDRGDRWRHLRVDRLPAGTVARLRSITDEQLTEALESLAEFYVLPGGELEQVEPGNPIENGWGVRRSGNVIQLGLTPREIADVRARLERLLDDVDSGRIAVF